MPNKPGGRPSRPSPHFRHVNKVRVVSLSSPGSTRDRDRQVDVNTGPGTAPSAKRFRTILADPPWDVQQKGRHGAAQHYDLMTLDRITNMPVGELAEDDAHLWLWVTNATLRAGYDVMEAWGFTPRSPLTWIKPRLGLGNYLRNATEHLILGTRGTAPVNFRAQPTWMFAPLQEHSHKPEEQYAVIERISDGPYLELFARRTPPTKAHWSVWGNQIDSDITVPGYPVPSDNPPPNRKGRG
ncbi:methyltransferase [Nakamurella silvestris]|nr:methyltransferase [Nakamurella silvestris]